MKRKATRILCLILCLTFLFAEAVPALGASSASDIQKRLEAMSKVSKYRDATYTSFNGKGWGSGCYSFTYALSMELFGVGIPPQKKNSDGYKTLLQTNDNWKEIGVAYSNDEVKTLLKSAQAGDIIQYRSDKTSPHHIKMIYSVTSTELKTWGSSGSAGASFQTYSWNKIAGEKSQKSKWSVGLGDFSPKGNGLSLYRCTKDVRTGNIGDDTKIPPVSPVTFSNYQVRKLTETGAEPYATATATNGKVARVGMFIGESKNSMIELGTDNGTPKAKKNMWYNTTKYGYPLEPGTTYYYQPYAEVNGKRYDGDVKSFTTPGEKYVPEPEPEPIVTPEPEPEPIVTPEPDPEPVPPSPSQEPSEPTYTALVTCNADNLNVRKGPGTNYDKVGSLKRGSKCTVYPNKASGGWSWVEGSGISGYVSTDRLTKFTGNTRTGVVTCNADVLNVRKGPGTSYDKVGQIPNGASCTVYLDVKADWYFVTYGDIAGYASKNKITLK